MISFDFNKFTNQGGPQAPKMKAMKPARGHIIAFLITVLVAAITFYISMPAINIRTSGSTLYIVFILGMFAILDSVFLMRITLPAKLTGAVAVALFLFMIVMSFFSAPFFRASAYREQLKINEASDFNESFETIALDKVPVIDLAAAKQLGDKKMGQVSGLGSQYNVSEDYTLISVKDNLYRVSPLEYQDLYKWFQNRNSGIPGYIKVNVTDPNDVQLIELKDGMKYSPSAYLNQNLLRHVRLSYPTDLLEDFSFELDDEDHPYWVVSTYEPSIGFYGGKDATGVIIVDPITGDMQKYGLDDVPTWVDRVQPAEIAMNQLNNWGIYVNGFWNTIFGQKDMLNLTSTFNYVTINGQTNVFTGVTSVGSDRSIVGFALINLKTKEAEFYKVNGADEASAKASAEGEVQNLGYKATDPIILNIANKPSYFVSLKDNAGLVKKFGFVSLENYSIVGIGDTVKEAQAEYIRSLKEGGATSEDLKTDLKQSEGVITTLNSAIVEGNSNYYFQIEGVDKLFVAPIALSEELAITKNGDHVNVSYIESDDATIIVDAFDNTNFNY